MVLIKSRTLSSPKRTIFSGVSATLNSARLALLTPASVAWADSTTATSSVKGLTYSSSLLGSGFASARRRNNSVTAAGLSRERPPGRAILALEGCFLERGLSGAALRLAPDRSGLFILAVPRDRLAHERNPHPDTRARAVSRGPLSAQLSRAHR